MPAIETRDLRKTYVSHKKAPGIMGSIKGLVTREKVEVEAVKGVDLSIEQGELVGFLGPNGAGKTTTLKMLSGILYPTSGEARVLGYTPSDRNPEMLRQISLVMGNKQQLWWDLPAWDSFVVLKELYEVSEADFKRRVDHLVEALQISDKVNTQVRKLSLGERMKCELVAALLYAPKVIFLDEPTLGLDVVSQKRIREFLKQLHQEEGGTFLLTSHYMQDVQELCDRVVVIDHGSVVYEGTLEDLSERFSDSRRIRLAFSTPVQEMDLVRFGRVVERSEEGAVVEVPRAETARATAGLLESLPVSDLSIESVDIEEVIRDLFERK
ncbi:ABC transporter ATP-binding protein [Fimbriimonas ginsengisoli]|uniref:ABC transporter-like protein n=1 Tax=Fimbriimonas ginsengisoli Gsoil 348 TaxID=661478 RepID=A0A068NNM1_FIMGI|nr:ATP-binding cassette domain-containing protein [Fimbriimonas ginsengisoli]AIE85148.1 ABC transporter-like protein [Fimbriimonas ginsengisoli Gsoil 348]